MKKGEKFLSSIAPYGYVMISLILLAFVVGISGDFAGVQFYKVQPASGPGVYPV